MESISQNKIVSDYWPDIETETETADHPQHKSITQ
jgi:hypothetical protein